MTIKNLRQALLYLAQHVITSPWPALATVTVLSIALGWPNVIYGFEGIPAGAQHA